MRVNLFYLIVSLCVSAQAALATSQYNEVTPTIWSLRAASEGYLGAHSVTLTAAPAGCSSAELWIDLDDKVVFAQLMTIVANNKTLVTGPPNLIQRLS